MGSNTLGASASAYLRSAAHQPVWRGRTRGSDAGEIARKLAEAGCELVVIVEDERTPLVEGAQRHPVLARHEVQHARADHLFDVVATDLGVVVDAVDDHGDAVRGVALAQRRRDAAGVAHGGELLVGDDDDP